MAGKFRIVPGGKGDLQPVILETLRRMKTRFGICGLKLSTEDAAMSLDQIDSWNRLCQGILPVVVKIGGPNARNDIRQMLKLNVQGLIAPMVESAFGLENYIEALRDYTTPLRFQALEKHINIETLIAVNQLEAILDSPSAKYIDEITIGQKDLSRSMQRSVNDPEVQATVHQVVQQVRSRNIPVSIGGGIIPNTIGDVLRNLSPDRFNTRILSFSVDSRSSYHEAVQEALEFEIMALKHDATQGFVTHDEAIVRVQELHKRLISPQ